MYTIVYTSKSTQPVTDDDLRGILHKARSNNTELGVSGMLLYHDGCFIQVLEGERDVVRGLYKKIDGDKRHNSVVTLWDGEIAERQFDGWSMGFRQSAEDDLKNVPGFTDWLERPAEAWSPDQNKTMADSFLGAFKRTASRFSRDDL